jgi:hypothetical protein
MQPQEPGSSVHCAMSATEALPEGCSPEECSCFVQDTEVYCTNLARSPSSFGQGSVRPPQRLRYIPESPRYPRSSQVIGSQVYLEELKTAGFRNRLLVECLLGWRGACLPQSRSQLSPYARPGLTLVPGRAAFTFALVRLVPESKSLGWIRLPLGAFLARPNAFCR